jgi:hypothetical protein
MNELNKAEKVNIFSRNFILPLSSFPASFVCPWRFSEIFSFCLLLLFFLATLFGVIAIPIDIICSFWGYDPGILPPTLLIYKLWARLVSSFLCLIFYHLLGNCFRDLYLEFGHEGISLRTHTRLWGKPVNWNIDYSNFSGIVMRFEKVVPKLRNLYPLTGQAGLKFLLVIIFNLIQRPYFLAIVEMVHPNDERSIPLAVTDNPESTAAIEEYGIRTANMLGLTFSVIQDQPEQISPGMSCETTRVAIFSPTST